MLVPLGFATTGYRRRSVVACSTLRGVAQWHDVSEWLCRECWISRGNIVARPQAVYCTMVRMVSLAGHTRTRAESLIRNRGFRPVEYLSGFFDVLEITTSFYGPPMPQTTRDWVEHVAENPAADSGRVTRCCAHAVSDRSSKHARPNDHHEILSGDLFR
jgi:hypothetical protein